MKSHCPYCALQCGIDLQGSAEAAILAGDAEFPVNQGALCIKGWTAARLLDPPGTTHDAFGAHGERNSGSGELG